MILEKKICNTCKETKELSEFEFRKDTKRYRNQCFVCRKEFQKNYRKTKEGKEAELRYRKSKKYLLNRAKRRKTLEYKEKRKKYVKDKMKTDNLFFIKNKIRRTVKKSLYRKGYTKKSKTNDILGCSYEEFLNHLESLFEPWMNWENKGLYKMGVSNYGWDLDHKTPLASAKTEEEVIKLNHYTNIQPLCSYVNRELKKDNLEFNCNI
jgi:hypothetical protein